MITKLVANTFNHVTESESDNYKYIAWDKFDLSILIKCIRLSTMIPDITRCLNAAVIDYSNNIASNHTKCLPNEILALILEYSVDENVKETLPIASSVCKKWNSITKSNGQSQFFTEIREKPLKSQKELIFFVNMRHPSSKKESIKQMKDIINKVKDTLSSDSEILLKELTEFCKTNPKWLISICLTILNDEKTMVALTRHIISVANSDRPFDIKRVLFSELAKALSNPLFTLTIVNLLTVFFNVSSSKFFSKTQMKMFLMNVKKTIEEMNTSQPIKPTIKTFRGESSLLLQAIIELKMDKEWKHVEDYSIDEEVIVLIIKHLVSVVKSKTSPENIGILLSGFSKHLVDYAPSDFQTEKLTRKLFRLLHDIFKEIFTTYAPVRTISSLAKLSDFSHDRQFQSSIIDYFNALVEKEGARPHLVNIIIKFFFWSSNTVLLQIINHAEKYNTVKYSFKNSAYIQKQNKKELGELRQYLEESLSRQSANFSCVIETNDCINTLIKKFDKNPEMLLEAIIQLCEAEENTRRIMIGIIKNEKINAKIAGHILSVAGSSLSLHSKLLLFFRLSILFKTTILFKTIIAQSKWVYIKDILEHLNAAIAFFDKIAQIDRLYESSRGRYYSTIIALIAFA